MPVPLLRGANRQTGIALPDPYPVLAQSKFRVQFFPRQFVMLAGAPGAGKTWMALDMAIKMGVPCLYVSADSDDVTMRIRAAAMLTGHDQLDVRKAAERGLLEEFYGPHLEKLNIRFVFDPSEPSMFDITHALEAYLEINGAYPELVVIDNIANVDAGTDNEWVGVSLTAKDFHFLARKTQACVLALHHTSEQNPNWITSAPPRSAIQGKISKYQSLILTTASVDSELFLAVVKNRFGRMDPNALEPFRFAVDFARGQIWPESPQREGVARWLISGTSVSG